uniref:DUF3098 domain-containing protein n=1 Tax=uncultured Bacteroidota bacterium TaxID=152509 RepID=H5SMS4_9BACT|nr:hypothetical protein HGMM_F50F04C23 [uncultured Bacteroidetes bacterium]
MTTKEKKPSRPEQEAMPFTRANYRLLVIGALILVVGYALLLQPANFVDSKVFSVALYVAPWVILGGIGTLIYAILKK